MSDIPAATLETEALVKTYGDRTVVNGVNLRFRSGEVVGLLGPNGAGKFYMVVGLVPATAGRVRLDGTEITRLRMHERARHGIGYLPQEASVFRKLTVAENILAVLEATGVPAKVRAARVEAHLAELHLGHVARQKAFTLSGGERRRLEIARALVTRPKLMLLDEPFAAVDPHTVEELQVEVRRLADNGIAMLVTDHNVQQTLRICDRAYIVHEGRNLRDGAPKDIINDPMVRDAYLASTFRGDEFG
jgi:lipopolysaccharide export system ATP-binding protein